MNARWSWFNITSVVFGFAFLYLPILLLVIYSFNESGWSPSGPAFRPSGMASCSETRADGCGLGDDPRRFALGHDRHRSGHIGRGVAGALHPFQWPYPVHRHGLCAAW
jgi:hypothetical protein